MTNNNNNPFISPNEPVCPKGLLAKARNLKTPKIAIAQAGSNLALASVKEAFEANILEPILIGNPSEISKNADELQFDISNFVLLEAEGEEQAAQTAFKLARDNEVDSVMKGHLHTDVLMKAALNKETGIYIGQRFVHIFHMTAPHSEKPLLISDAAVNVTPNEATLHQAIKSTIDLARSLDIPTPKIAFLSATEERIASVPSSIVAGALADWAQENFDNIYVHGPLALDGIISPEAAKTKGMTSEVAGQADIVIVPDIVSGNVLFKALVYMTGACAGGIVMGGKVPIILTSRADPPAARLASAALAAILCQQQIS